MTLSDAADARPEPAPFRLRAVELLEIRLPLIEPFRISSGVCTERRIMLLAVEDQSGTIGWGECVAGELPNYSAETIDTAWFALEHWLIPRLLHRDVEHPDDVHRLLAPGIVGHPMAKAGLEMACWELAARVAGVSLSQLLGGTRDRVAAGISLGIQREPESLVERALAARAQGYAKIKVKIRPGADVEFVRAVRDALGTDVALMADANSAYSLDDAARLAELDAFGLTMLEQPLGQDDLVRHAELQRRMTTPLCLDESITSVDRCEDMIALRSGRIVNIKPGRVGGFAVSRRIHDVCAAHGIPVWCGGMLESGIGRAHNVALASLPNFTMPGDLSPSRRYWERDIVEPEWTMDRSGHVRVPGGAGMGVEPDIARIDGLKVRFSRRS